MGSASRTVVSAAGQAGAAEVPAKYKGEKWARLGVNVDHVATVRNARGTAYPDPVEAALVAAVGDAVGKIIGFLKDNPGIVSAFVAGFAGLAGVKKSVDGVSSAFSSVKSKVDAAKAGSRGYLRGCTRPESRCFRGQWGAIWRVTTTC